jgi:hypothetical protein
MMPPSSPAERRVLRWFLLVLGLAAAVLIGATWWSKSRACAQHCAHEGYAQGSLQFTGGGRIMMSTRCACSAPRPSPSPT